MTTPTNARVFEKRSMIPTTLAKIWAFHESRAALSALTPPPIFIQIREDRRDSLTTGDLEFTLWFAVFPLRWHVQHEAGPTAHSFVDRMLTGPMAYWRHEHLFEETATGVELVDRVTLAHKDGWQGWLTRLMFDGMPLRILFWYRHFRTRWAVS
jgi:ligand-binding SRPBCC domain-containing protein